jgi:methionine-rich copper-binding protein CopC
MLSAAVLLLSYATPVPGHAIVIESSPKSGEVLSRTPTEVSLRFNSRIEKALSRVTVTGPGNDPLPLPQATLNSGPDRLVVPLPSLEPGAYLIRWRVLSADGHVTQGAFRFAVAPAR